MLIGLPGSSFAQTQKGYVKTKGRMVDGKLVPGQGLKGATVSVQGRNTVVVNKDDGEFSFPVPDNQFKLDSVRKKGYRLVDMDACPRTYNYSGNPIYIVMETPDQQLQDQLNAERKIRRNLQRQLQDKEDEIEDLKAQQKITDDEYRKALQKLYQDQENNEQLIKDMAKRYSELDYDQLDEFYRQVSYCIENGELVKADSLLNTKGDVTKQIEEEKQKGRVIQEQKRRIKKAEALHVANIEELAKRCYSYYENFKAQHLNDTAAYYLELRASLDTTNVDWQNDAGEFIRDYIADYNKALTCFQKELRQSVAQFGEQNEKTALAYNNISVTCYYLGDYDNALKYYNTALDIRKSIFGDNHTDVALSYNNMGVVYNDQGDYEKALEYYNKALDILKSVFGENHPDVATCYDNIGLVYYYLGDYDYAWKYNIKSLEIRLLIFGENHPDVAISYNNIGLVYHYQGDYEKALEYYNKALSILKTVFGEMYPDVATCYDNIGLVCCYQGEYAKALEYQTKSLNIRLSVFGERHPDVAISYNNMGLVYQYQADYAKALEYYNMALSIWEEALGSEHPYTKRVQGKISEVESKLAESDTK